VGAKNPALMVETDELITEVRFEYTPLLNYEAENNFEIGFRNFLLADSFVNLKEDDYDTAVSYIRQHMEGGVGLWTETAVIEQLKNWKLSLIPASPKPGPKPGEDDGPETPGVTEPSSSSEKKEKAKAKIHSLSTIDEAKRILDALCDLGYDSVLDTILK
jgi:hypothetical protein